MPQGGTAPCQPAAEGRVRGPEADWRRPWCKERQIDVKSPYRTVIDQSLDFALTLRSSDLSAYPAQQQVGRGGHAAILGDGQPVAAQRD